MTPAPPDPLHAPIPVEPEPVAFDPVPLQRVRRDGWTAARQRAFVAALRKWGSVSEAARAVGKSRQSANQLRGKPGATSFAEAWDIALDMARGDAGDIVRQIGIQGERVPVFYRGRLTGYRRRFDRKLLLGLLADYDRRDNLAGAAPMLSGPGGRIALSENEHGLLRTLLEKMRSRESLTS